MAYAEDTGYVPLTISEIMEEFRALINTQFGTTYTTESFVGSNFYKYFYAIAQRQQENEVKTSEIFQNLQDYFEVINAMIARPVVTSPGLIEKLLDEGYTASVKPMVDADAGKIHVCVDADDGDHATGLITITSYANLVSGTDDAITINGTAFTAQVGAATLGTGTFQAATSNTATATSLAAQINSHAVVSLLVVARATGAKVYLTAVHGGTAPNAYTLTYTDNDTNVGATVSGATLSGGAAPVASYDDVREAICTILAASCVAGAVTQGNESETIVLSNGQSFDFKYNLPRKIEALYRLTITLSENNQVVVGSPDDDKTTLLANMLARYALGKNFEPQRYFSVVDAPWAASVLLEYSIDGGDTYLSTIYEADYDELFVIDLAAISIVEV